MTMNSTTHSAVTAVKRAERKSIARLRVRRGFILETTRVDARGLYLKRRDTTVTIDVNGVIAVVGADAGDVARLIAEAQEHGQHRAEDQGAHGADNLQFQGGPLADMSLEW